MLGKYFQGQVPIPGEEDGQDRELREMALELPARISTLMDQLQFSNALAELWRFIGRANKYIDETAPWALAKNGQTVRLATVMYNLLECLRIVSVLLLPFMPRTPEKIWQQLGIADYAALQTWQSIQEFGGLPGGIRTAPAEVLFPRLELVGEGKAPVRQATKREQATSVAQEER